MKLAVILSCLLATLCLVACKPSVTNAPVEGKEPTGVTREASKVLTLNLMPDEDGIRINGKDVPIQVKESYGEAGRKWAILQMDLTSLPEELYAFVKNELYMNVLVQDPVPSKEEPRLWSLYTYFQSPTQAEQPKEPNNRYDFVVRIGSARLIVPIQIEWSKPLTAMPEDLKAPFKID